MKTITLLFVLIGISAQSQTKIKIDVPNAKNRTIESIVKSLEGEGIIIENITTNQLVSSNQIGQFYDKKYTLSMERGLLLSTGSVKNIIQKNQHSGMTGKTSSSSNTNQQEILGINSQHSENDTFINIVNSKAIGDEDLLAELGKPYQLFDACIVEMDIIPLGDTLNFRYLFASEEYDEYVCSEFNDAFAFFISGEGISKKKNMAVLKTGDRISINSINNGNPFISDCEKQNPSFYKKNEGNIPLEFDGFTRTLEILQPVKAFNKYHLKIVIADASDGIYDSGVFIESKSVISFNKRYIIPFDSDQSLLSDKTESILDAMMNIVENHPEYKLEISGHTDSEGSEAYNLLLSKSRMNRVIDYIKDQGFNEGSLIKINRGESMPITTNNNSQGKKLNRRVEIKLIPSITDSYNIEPSKSLSQLKIQSINPNPARSSAKIKIENLSTIDIATLFIHNIKGNLITTIPVNKNMIEIDVSKWESGIYNATITSNNIKATKKFVVVK